MQHDLPSPATPKPAARRSRASILVRILAVTAVLCASVFVLPAAVAQAHTTNGYATPANDGTHPWTTNGCSTPGVRVNAVAGIYDFGHACKHHDGCYIGFPRNGQPTYWTSRWQCDAWFLYDMQASCRWQHGSNTSATWAGRQCEQWASNYHWAVRTYGSGGYKGPWNN